MFNRKRSGEPEPADDGPLPHHPDPRWDVMLAETIARHFEQAYVDGKVAVLGADGLRVECAVSTFQEFGAQVSASLFFRISGGSLGDQPAFASVSGYDASHEAAVVLGACNWACVFGEILRCAGATPPSTLSDEVGVTDLTIDGRRFRLVVTGLDRLMQHSDDYADPSDTLRETRQHLGPDTWLAPAIAGSGTLPYLTKHGSTLLSVFVMEVAGSRTVEIKVNGGDWIPSAQPLAAWPTPKRLSSPLLRELAVLVPLEPRARLARNPLERTLFELGLHSTDPFQAAGWQGWQRHGGHLAPPLDAAGLAAIERQTGPLPPDYRAFLTEVASSGAGPGYGLMYPSRFEDVVPLAHAGCGNVWYLRLDAASYGQVWVDAAGSDERVEQVAPDFDTWYSAWLDSTVRDDGPWIHWDRNTCASASVYNQVLTAQEERGEPTDRILGLGEGAIKLTSGGNRFLPSGVALDPCHGCVELGARLGVPPSAFARGVLLKT